MLSEALVGAWTLVSCTHSTSDGATATPLGPHPRGILIYTDDGRMSVIISHTRRNPLSGADRWDAPVEERAEAFSTSFAYAGRYSVDGDSVTHHVEVSTVENWVNTDMVRMLAVKGDRLTLTTPPISLGGTVRTATLVWERLR